MFTEDQLLPLSALQHWLFCPRQCGLIHLEQVWAENKFTAEGQVLHHKAHEGGDETKVDVRITRSLPVRSLVLGISGQCDIVEFHPADDDLKFEIPDLRGGSDDDSKFDALDMRWGGDSDLSLEIPDLRFQISNFKCVPRTTHSAQHAARVVPVEYKRGKPKSHRADEVQLCAQAMCLEEMLGVTIASGYLYYGENRRRTMVDIDATLRQLVAATAAALHAMIDSRVTPLAEYESCRCDACSLIELCQPQALRFKRGVQAWFTSALKSAI